MPTLLLFFVRAAFGSGVRSFAEREVNHPFRFVHFVKGSFAQVVLYHA